MKSKRSPRTERDTVSAGRVETASVKRQSGVACCLAGSRKYATIAVRRRLAAIKVHKFKPPTIGYVCNPCGPASQTTTTTTTTTKKKKKAMVERGPFPSTCPICKQQEMKSKATTKKDAKKTKATTKKTPTKKTTTD